MNRSWKECQRRASSLFLWAGQLLLHIPVEVLGRDCPPAPSSAGWSGSPPRCFTALGEGGMKPQAQDIYNQCGLTFTPRKERSRKEGSVAETKRHLLYCSRTGAMAGH